MSYEDVFRSGGSAALREAEKFLMHEGAVFNTLRSITGKLEALGIPYAVAGGMALVAHGYNRTTTDVDILLSPLGLGTLHEKLSGLGYVEPFPGSRNLRDVSTGVRIEFLVSGQFPGDGKPKPFAFPDPATCSIVMDGIHYLRLSSLLDFKLASGMTGGVARLKDFADVVELIKALQLPLGLSQELAPYVRDKYIELWNGLQGGSA